MRPISGCWICTGWPRRASDVQWRDALDAADIAALMMLGQRTDPGEAGGGWLDPALGHRAEIHQATGMVLVQLGVSATDALAFLPRTRSSTSGC